MKMGKPSSKPRLGILGTMVLSHDRHLDICLMYSLAETAKFNGLELQAWLAEVIRHIAFIIADQP